MCEKELQLHHRKVVNDNNDIIVKCFNELTSHSFATHFGLHNLDSKTFKPSNTEIVRIKNKWSL